MICLDKERVYAISYMTTTFVNALCDPIVHAREKPVSISLWNALPLFIQSAFQFGLYHNIIQVQVLGYKLRTSYHIKKIPDVFELG